jgi:hypothetical protein
VEWCFLEVKEAIMQKGFGTETAKSELLSPYSLFQSNLRAADVKINEISIIMRDHINNQ